MFSNGPGLRDGALPLAGKREIKGAGMIRIFSYSRESERMETPGIADLPRHLSDRGRMIWADLENPTDEETGVLGGMFGFHVLAVEDCMQPGLLPKFNLFDG